MRELYLIRHGNATPEQADADHQRALTEVGIQEAVQAAQFMQVHGVAPHTILYSDALRTTMTAQTVADTMAPTPKLVSNSQLYNASLEQWISVINGLNDELTSVIAIGHNLGISRFANYLNGDFLPDMHTCSIYGFRFEVDTWRDVAKGTGQLILQFSP